MWQRLRLVAAIMVAGLAANASAETSPALAEERRGERVDVRLLDGSRYTGVVVAEDDAHVTLSTEAGERLRFERGSISSLRAPATAATEDGPFTDPQYSRLILLPSSQPLRRGDGHVSAHYGLVPGVALGLTDNLSVSAGTLPVRDPLFYFTAQLGLRASDSLSLSATVSHVTWPAIFAEHDRRDSETSAYFLAGWESRRGQITAGLGVLDLDDHTGPVARPVVGGKLTLSKHVALLGEAAIGAPHVLPVSAGVRFFSRRLSADVGLALGGIPWVSVSYHFGPSRRGGSRL